LILTEILRVYFIMPFPGSQHSATIAFAYFIDRHKWILRFIGLLLVIKPAYRLLTRGKILPKILFSLFIIIYGIIFFYFNFRFQADKMFYQPEIRTFSAAKDNAVDSNKLVIAIDINGQARAYPIQIIGYHHQVRDTVGGEPIMVTYCTVCRTGRVYRPFVDGKPETFRLVGMDHFNAMFEDGETKSWWQQATGVAVAGPLKGHKLEEVPSHQYSLAAWLRLHPNSTVLQPDSNFKEDYSELSEFDKGTIKGHLEKRDSSSWKMKSWVIGIKANSLAKAYDWNILSRDRLLQDSIGKLPILLILEGDTSSFHAFNRQVRGVDLYFQQDANTKLLTDSNTHSQWDFQGNCISGSLKNSKLEELPSYQEFWHSWKQFHPNTTQYNP
jgi:hypothetical protein